MTPRRILVPLDGRRASEAALAIAGELASAAGGTLYVIRVLETPGPSAEASVRHRAAAQQATRYLGSVRQRVTAEAGVELSTAVWSGSPAAAIVKAAELIEADMIVMATGARSGAPPKLVGSVVERVLAGTRRPVVVVTAPEALVDTSLGDAAPLPNRVLTDAETRLPADPPAAGDRALAPTEAYLESLRPVEECERDVVRMVTTIQDAAKRLERWQAVHVAHAGAGFPKEVTMAGRAIDATTWPTAGQLADTLADWHSAAESARVAWSHVPDEERSGLPPPP
ncbi:MAG TPA: universal stress protein [Methylomirabilota bacterium]|nr:universal stress protein [Methylomirabilota bacterium]